MLRRLFTLASVLSLLLCFATAVLWVRSYWRADVAWSSLGRVYFDASTDSGTIGMQIVSAYRWTERTQWQSFPAKEYNGRYDNLPSLMITMGEFHRWRHFGLSGDYGVTRADLNDDGTVRRSRQEPRGNGSDAMRYWSVDYVPLWVPFLLTSLMPLGRLVGFVRRQRRPLNYCVACGYDLRASLDRCPECGQIPEKTIA